jgi:ATP-dependent exoDNAse (exonuclease V) beta subunit
VSGTVDLSGLNEPQRRIATTLDRPLFVEAGAGSGKTFTLTQRVAWALAPGSGAGGAPFLDGLDQVLVITFTEAAAREIKERVRSTLRRAHMGQAALAVDDAWISTIHAMCSRILHRHALDLGLDPAFSVAEGSEAAALLARAMDDVMRDARRDPAFAGAFKEYDLGVYSPQNGYKGGVMQRVERLVREGHAQADGLGAFAPATANEQSLNEAVRALAARTEELAACRLTPAAVASVVPSLEALRAYEGLAPGARTSEAVRETLAAVSVPRASKAISAEVAAVKSALELARAEAELVRVAPLADELLELARCVEARFGELKRQGSCLDNDDLVRLALLAVRDHESVRRDYVGRFRLVMVDEFQDTDEMQLELIGLLSGEGACHLCTVGDAQQSIYRFRGADVGVFRSRGESVDAGGAVRLDTNYRSHADVLSFVERVATGGGGPSVAGTMSGFMHLGDCPTREDAYRARGLPRIDVEVVGGSSRGMTAARKEAMAAQVAEALARYRDHGERPGGMALLLGVTTHADLYIDAIRQTGMECVVTGGSTFTSTDEVKVVCALLHTLANPTDTQSGLFPLLASEMFGLDANDFCELGTRLQDKLDAPTKRPIDRGLLDMVFYGGHEPSARLVRAHDVLVRALGDVATRPVADVCADVARDSGWLARLEAAGAAGLACAANVLAAVRYVRDLTQSLGLGAARAATEFDLWLAASKIAPASLAGADEGDAGGTVRVMTIHASKGLEFPVCAVAECWGNSAGDSALAFASGADGRRSFVLRPQDPLSLAHVDPEELEPSADKSQEPLLAARYLAARASDDEAEAQEKARLLYVALTRAREALVLGIDASAGKAGVSSKLAAAALGALGVDAGTAGETSVDYGGSEPAAVRCAIVEKDDADAGEEGDASDGDAGPAPEAAPDSQPEPFDLYAPEAPAPGALGTWRARAGVFSYSRVHEELAGDAHAGARELPGRDEREDAGALAAEDADRATSLGSAFHELAQAMVESGHTPHEAQVQAMTRRWNLSVRAEGRLRAALARWSGSHVRAEALSHGLVRAEVPFFQRVDSPHGDYLEGALDLLCTDADSERALVVDYKTGDAGLSLDEVRARHALQAQFYAGVLLAEGYARVDCAFVCVERDDPDAPGEPLVIRYEFERPA